MNFPQCLQKIWGKPPFFFDGYGEGRQTPAEFSWRCASLSGTATPDGHLDVLWESSRRCKLQHLTEGALVNKNDLIASLADDIEISKVDAGRAV